MLSAPAPAPAPAPARDYSAALQCYILTVARQAAYIALEIASFLCRTHQLVSSTPQ